MGKLVRNWRSYLGALLTFASIPLGFPFARRITSSFGYRENPFGGYDVEAHQGLDIKGHIAPRLNL